MRVRSVESPSSPCVSVVVLAGGRNSRMGGRDKAFLSVNGEPAIDRMLRVLSEEFHQVIVATNSPAKYGDYDVELVEDEFPHLGPLAGIHAGLSRVESPYAFVIACDMPFLRLEPIRFLIERIDGQDAIIPRWEGDIEPLHGVYAVALRDPIELALRSGVTAIREFLPRIQAEYVSEHLLRGIPGAEESFRNLNTPEEAARFAIQVQSSR